jgi:hypothetical protein
LAKRGRIFAAAKSERQTTKILITMERMIEFSLLSEAVRTEMLALIADLDLELVPQPEAVC